MFPLSTPLPLKNYLHYPKKEMSMGLSIHTFAAERKNPYNEAAKEVLRYEKQYNSCYWQRLSFLYRDVRIQIIRRQYGKVRI